MESEAAEAQEQLSEMGLIVTELRGSLATREKEITTLQTRYTHIQTHSLHRVCWTHYLLLIFFVCLWVH